MNAIPHRIQKQLHWNTNGKPEKLLFILGFGQKPQVLDAFATLLHDYDVMVLTFPWGQQEQPLTAEEVIAFSKTLMQHNNGEKITVIAYSLGARFALYMLRYAPETLKHIVFLAPEGFRKIAMFRFCVHTWLGRILFKWVTQHPKLIGVPLQLILKLFKHKPKTLKLLNFQFSDLRQSQLLYNTWNLFKTKIAETDLHLQLIANPVHIDVVYGKYDSIIKPLTAAQLQKMIPAQVHLVARSHYLIHRSVAQELKVLLPHIFMR